MQSKNSYFHIFYDTIENFLLFFDDAIEKITILVILYKESKNHYFGDAIEKFLFSYFSMIFLITHSTNSYFHGKKKRKPKNPIFI